MCSFEHIESVHLSTCKCSLQYIAPDNHILFSIYSLWCSSSLESTRKVAASAIAASKVQFLLPRPADPEMTLREVFTVAVAPEGESILETFLGPLLSMVSMTSFANVAAVLPNPLAIASVQFDPEKAPTATTEYLAAVSRRWEGNQEKNKYLVDANPKELAYLHVRCEEMHAFMILTGREYKDNVARAG
jgi:hypothetical protein